MPPSPYLNPPIFHFSIPPYSTFQVATTAARQALAATLLTGENAHTYTAATLKGDVRTKLLRTMSVGTGAKSLLVRAG